MTYIDFNINDYVMVRLTDYGRALHRERFDELKAAFPRMTLEYQPKEEDEDGWSKWQAWDLIQSFGPNINMGGNLPFETTIRIITK